jgi:hypothetical protein
MTDVQSFWGLCQVFSGHRNNVSYALKVYREADSKEIRNLKKRLVKLCNNAH